MERKAETPKMDDSGREVSGSVFHQRLRSAAAGESQSKIARRSGIPQSTLSRIWAGGVPDLDQVAAIAKALGKPMEWMMGGDDDGDVVRIPNLVLKRSANDNAQPEKSYTSLPVEILERIGVPIEHARVVTAWVGLAMRPTINDGDLLVIDTSDTAVADGNVYVVSAGDDVHVRRLRRKGGGVMMRADNRDLFPDEEALPDDATVHGRVRWAGHVF